MPLPVEKKKPSVDLWNYTILLYGESKIGKSTLLSQIPNVLFLNTGGGLEAIECFEQPITTWEEFLQTGKDIIEGKHEFKVIAIDTDPVHLFCASHNAQICGVDKNIDFKGIINLAIISTLLSNVVSNVPAVLLLNPIISSINDNRVAWLVISMATTFAGNLTLLGSVANMIVAESASKSGVKLKFIEYMKTGIPITIITIFIGIIWFAVLM